MLTFPHPLSIGSSDHGIAHHVSALSWVRHLQLLGWMGDTLPTLQTLCRSYQGSSVGLKLTEMIKGLNTLIRLNDATLALLL